MNVVSLSEFVSAGADAETIRLLEFTMGTECEPTKENLSKLARAGVPIDQWFRATYPHLIEVFQQRCSVLIEGARANHDMLDMVHGGKKRLQKLGEKHDASHTRISDAHDERVAGAISELLD